jgi:hypothetical protein
VETYAVPADYRRLNTEAQGFSEMLQMLSDDKRRQMNGPLWVTPAEFRAAESNALSKHPRLEILVNQNCTVLLKFLN